MSTHKVPSKARQAYKFIESHRNEFSILGGSLIATRERDIPTAVYTTKYYHTDALGSPIAITNPSKVVIQTSEFEPYGKVVNRAEVDGPSYTGHVQDASSGLSYMQQRYYDPMIGRFLSVDPVTANSGTGANFNRYWYAANNPYKFIDPDGRAPFDKNESPKLSCPTVKSCERERQREKNEQRKKEKQGLIGQIVSFILGTPDTPNHTNSGPENPDPDKWRIAATVYDTNSATVDSSGPILIQPGSLAFPAPTYQFYYTVYQRPLGANGQLESVANLKSWFKPVVHGSGGTGLFDRAAYRYSTDVIGSGGSRWYIEIRNSESTHDNAQDPFLNIYVPVDR